MKNEILKSKLEVFVTSSNQEGDESIALDKRLMYHSNLINHEKVHITCDTKKSRVSTYVVEGELDSRMVELNGNIAKHFDVGDKITILCYQHYNPTFQFKPYPIFVETKCNKMVSVKEQ